MAVPAELIPTLGPITAAIIAGSISFIVTVLSKDQKTSEFRQNWIDKLRDEVADLVSIFETLFSTLSIKELNGEDTESLQKFMFDRHDDFIKMEACVTKIKLRLNPKEHKELLSLLSSVNGDNELTKENAKPVIASIVTETQVILKKEWERVKAGELTFRVTKWTSLLVFVSALAMGILYTTEHIKIVHTL